ncbi:MAG: uncharacterized protein A8A55_2369, partial [Amphiamblys sp. WSBS2006]
METETTRTLKLGNTFFVFTDKNVFLIPKSEYSHFQQDKEGYICLKRKHLSEVTDRDTGRLICIVCHEEAGLKDFISPLCRQMHFVFCRACAEYLKGRTDRREVACPYCKEKRGDKTCQEEIIGVLVSRMPHKTLQYLELKPDMEVETVTKLTRKTKVVISNVVVSDALFFGLMSNTIVTIRNRVSLFGHDNSLDCCLGEFNVRICNAPRFCFDGYTDEDMKQIHENIKTTPKKSIQFSAGGINAKEDGIGVLLKLSGSVDGHVSDLFLESSTKDHIEEILETAGNLIWIGRAKKLTLIGRAIQLLPALGLHEENTTEEISLRVYDHGHIAEILNTENSSVSVGAVKKLSLYDDAIEILPKICFREAGEMESLVLDSDFHDCVAEILKTENNSLWVGKVKCLKLNGHAVQILPKLRIHQENVMEELVLLPDCPENIFGMLGMENKSIWVGKVGWLELKGHAVGIFPKLRIHEENVMEVLELNTDHPEDVAEILKEENNSIWVGKVEKLKLEDYALEILPKLEIHEENVMEELGLEADNLGYITGILEEENNSIWVGKVKRLELYGYTVGILPKLRIHEENVMEELWLYADKTETPIEIHKTENNSIWVGRVKWLKLDEYAVEILPKLRIHEENVMEFLELLTRHPGNITEILKEENNSIWVGRVKVLCPQYYAVQILPKLRIHGENEMEELVLDADKPEHITEILKEENGSIWVGKVEMLGLFGYAVEILPKLRIHGENVMEEFGLWTQYPENIAEILRMKNNSIWIGKVKKLELYNYAIEILPKLGIHEENVMEELELDAYWAECIVEILKMENKSIWVGKVR